MASAESPTVAAEFGLTSRLQGSLPHLSKSMTRLADLLLDNPELPIQLSINELAERAQVSPATVTRFCRLLGYAGYVPLRVSAAADLGRSSAHDTWFAEIEGIEPETSAADVVRYLLAISVNAFQAGADLVDLTAVQYLARAIATSPHIDIYGVGASRLVAKRLQEMLYGIGVNVHAFGEVHLGLTSAALLDDQAVAIAISSTGRTTETCEMLALARERGAITAAITSDPQSPLATMAAVKIRTAPPSNFIGPSHLVSAHVQLFTCELVYLLVAQYHHARTQDAMVWTSAAIENHRQPIHRAPNAPPFP